jgi:hypothetical protein
MKLADVSRLHHDYGDGMIHLTSGCDKLPINCRLYRADQLCANRDGISGVEAGAVTVAAYTPLSSPNESLTATIPAMISAMPLRVIALILSPEK